MQLVGDIDGIEDTTVFSEAYHALAAGGIVDEHIDGAEVGTLRMDISVVCQTNADDERKDIPLPPGKEVAKDIQDIEVGRRRCCLLLILIFHDDKRVMLKRL